jgi:tetratricopeptide (TPR) repeat protein
MLTWRRGVAFLSLSLIAGGAYPGWRIWQRHSFEKQCQFARAQQDWRTERNIAERWIQVDPENGRPWWLAAEAAQNLEDLPSLAKYLAGVPDDDPNVLLAWAEKANLEWTALNQPLQAVKTTERALAVDPQLVNLHSRLISFYALSLQRAPMMKAIRFAIQHNAEPREAYAYILMADALTFVNGEGVNGRWLAAEPGELRFKIGVAVHIAMNYEQNTPQLKLEHAAAMDREAARQLDLFLEKRPHDIVLLTYLMHRAQKSADVERCGELLAQVEDADADDHMVWVFRAWYLRNIGDLAQAETSIQQALQLHPMSAAAHHEYAEILRRRKRPESEINLHQSMAAEATEIRSLVWHEESVDKVSAEVFDRIARYAATCGDQLVADALKGRIALPPVMGGS